MSYCPFCRHRRNNPYPYRNNPYRRNSDEDYRRAVRSFEADPTIDNYKRLLVISQRSGRPAPLLPLNITMTDYEANDPRGWGGDPSRGAAMGRPTIQGEPEGIIILRETVLDSGGYDRNGTYFGQGSALFWYADEGGNIDDTIRAQGRQEIEDIRAELAERYPNTIIAIGEPIRPKCYGLGDVDKCPYGGGDVTDYSDYCELCAADESSYCAICEQPCTEVGALDEEGSCASCLES